MLILPIRALRPYNRHGFLVRFRAAAPLLKPCHVANAGGGSTQLENPADKGVVRPADRQVEDTAPQAVQYILVAWGGQRPHIAGALARPQVCGAFGLPKSPAGITRATGAGFMISPPRKKPPTEVGGRCFPSQRKRGSAQGFGDRAARRDCCELVGLAVRHFGPVA